MKCFQCSSCKFEEKKVRFSPSLKNEVVDVIISTPVCTNCGSPLMSGDQINALRRAAADQFRENHNLLTSREIVQFREGFGMSQTAFAEYLGVGEASIKRWETYFIQDHSQDDHIRIKCDPIYAEFNLLRLQNHFVKPDIYTGMKPFSFDLFKQCALYFIKNTDAPIGMLQKLHFYADFLNFKKIQKSITGTRYVSLKLGPCPAQSNLLYHILQREKSIKKTSNETCYSTTQSPNISLFDDLEKSTLENVCAHQNNKKSCLAELSKKEMGFVSTNDHDYISYQHAKTLLI